jgi:transposase
MVKRYIVTLSDEERKSLEALIHTGRRSARQINHARILLKADTNQSNGGSRDTEIEEALDVSVRTIERVRQRFVEEGLDSSIQHRPGAGRKRKVTGEQEAHLIALRCRKPPIGHARWTLRLLADQMVELGYIDQISHETVRQTLKKMNCSRGVRHAG